MVKGCLIYILLPFVMSAVFFWGITGCYAPQEGTIHLDHPSHVHAYGSALKIYRPATITIIPYSDDDRNLIQVFIIIGWPIFALLVAMIEQSVRVKGQSGTEQDTHPRRPALAPVRVKGQNETEQDHAPISYRKRKPELLRRQGSRCNACQREAPADWLEIDHIISRREGGSDQLSNLQLLCSSCNRIKGPRSQDYLIARLREQGRRA